MATPAPSPREALLRWLSQLHYNSIRNIEIADNAITTDKGTVLRGFPLADDLWITRKRVFYKIIGKQAMPISAEEVSANYNLKTMQEKYRAAMESWKNTKRVRRKV
jgi:hypothetical protein